ncbi:hypothetical protein NGC34_00265 [Klebsiella michiganensis]|uniref:hypothetical protein n=1 Tax=Klebsiella michiganensis TaxID=1134687 RepID=UPI002DC327A2|nr:hypothetical protein [Klebsiella michiganensis]
MTTDITELAQREKFEAWAELVCALPWAYLKKRRTSDDTYSEPGYTDMWAAWKAASVGLVEALELKEEQRANWFQMAQKLGEDLDAAEKRIAELERGYENLRPVGVMSEKAYHRLENRESRFIALWPRPEIYLPRKRPEDGVIVYARTAASAGIKVETENIDADVSDRNQPGMVVAVNIDAGDFVKFRDQVYEVKETDFDDHDVTLWFVCGETLKCAAGCQIEVVTAPEEAE